MYLNVKWGSVSKSARVGENETYTLTAPDGMSFNDTETIVYGASMVKSLGDLSPLYVGTVDVSKMKRLTELIIGSDAEGYDNTNLRTLSVGTNEMLKLINIRNCTGYNQTVDLSGCENIESILAKGSMATGFSLPSGGNLKTLELPDSIKSLTIKNQPLLTEEGFSIEGVSNLTTLVLENTNVDTFALLAKCFSESTYTLERVRLLDVQGTTNSTVQLAKLINMGGVDENGNDISSAVVTGVCDVYAVYEDDLEALNQAFPELTINYETIWIKFEDNAFLDILLTFFDENGDGGINQYEATEYRSTNWLRFKDISTLEERTPVLEFDLGIFVVDHIEDDGGDNFPNCKRFIYPNYYTNRNLDGHYQWFMNNIVIEEIHIGDIVTLDRFSFYGCTSLRKVVLNNRLTLINGQCFRGCSSLEEISPIPDTCTRLGNDSIGGTDFLGCTSLKTLTIGSGVTQMGGDEFRDCTSMESFYIKATTPPSIGTNCFYNNPCKIYVPVGSGDAYKTATNWKVYASRIYEYDFNS